MLSLLFLTGNGNYAEGAGRQAIRPQDSGLDGKRYLAPANLCPFLPDPPATPTTLING